MHKPSHWICLTRNLGWDDWNCHVKVNQNLDVIVSSGVLQCHSSRSCLKVYGLTLRSLWVQSFLWVTGDYWSMCALCFYIQVYNSEFILFLWGYSVFMGSMEMPSQSPETFKVPTATYEFGANFLDPKVSCFEEHIYVFARSCIMNIHYWQVMKCLYIVHAYWTHINWWTDERQSEVRYYR